MCGVAAIYSYRDESPLVNSRELLSIRDVMIKRGPDAAGIWMSDDNRVGLAHRRLSIIDINSRSNQPMVSEDDTCVISFNGEIYNYQELKRNLTKKGYQFKTNSDTEVLLNLYRENGTKMCSMLRGMFAFVIWDKKFRKLIMVRDAYGIKPLYYSDDGFSIRIASQVKALCASDVLSKRLKISSAGIVGFLFLGSIPEPLTSYENIKSLPSGVVATIDSQGMKIEEYFSLYSEYKNLYNKEKPESIDSIAREALLDTVSSHTVGDVPVGIFLSAGLDSCSLLSLMNQSGYRNIQSMTLAFEEFKGSSADESLIAKKIASRYDVNHTTCIISKNDFVSYLPDILGNMDQPSIDGINTWFVSKAAKEAGLKVAISGLGGDEIFGGYPSFNNIPKMRFLNLIFGNIPGFSKGFERVTDVLLRKSNVSEKIRYIPRFYHNVCESYLLQRCIFLPHEISAILGAEFSSRGFSMLRNEALNFSSLNDLPIPDYPKISALETNFYMKNQLLRDSDWAGMAHSVEIRTPLVDIELLKSIGPSVLKMKKYNGKKLLSNNALSNEEMKVLQRKKTGFGLPMQRWFELKNSRLSGLYPASMNGNCHWSKKYLLHVLDVFHGDKLC